MPGVISDAYRRFWNYSVGNQILALFQCVQREIKPGPIHTFVGWRDLGRYVKKGEKALTLCMPVTIKRRLNESPSQETTQETAETVPATDGSEEKSERPTCFVYRPHWFVLSQTEGVEYVPAELPEWSEKTALESLKIQRVPFSHMDGNAQGYATRRQVAVSPVAFMPARTLLHEIAHVVLGHTEEMQRMVDDDSAIPRDLREVEAECVAMICCSSLDLGGEEFSRGYIQHWIKGQSIPERSAQRIFKAADEILKAGRATEPVASTSN
jgi:antirestriction protein ArdC